MTDSPAPYRVLARKYRPQRFSELIGQDAMVQTLANAIRRGRLAHAFLMTGVRGVGKTSTARLIAKALNCVGPDGQGGPTIDPCGVCEPCRAIAEGRDMDVIEMDAASNRGIDDVREVINIVRTGPNIDRYLVYIVDEVHMLTKEAFNALLKTLEEPPERVKFIFATTEVNKVPVTVLSRCQRFDLRRISAEALAAHFAAVAEAEGVRAEPEALALIARAAEGSARDGLSILDQAIAHGEEDGVTAPAVREMLGLSDRGAIRRLFGLLVGGEALPALAELREMHDLGVEPASVFRGLLEVVHGITRAKVGGAEDPSRSAEERAALADWASRMGHATLHRLWQLLLKGLAEVQGTELPLEAAEMGLLRLIHAADMPDPGELLRRLSGGVAVAPPTPAPVEPPVPAGPDHPNDFRALLEVLESNGQPNMAVCLHDRAELVRYEAPTLSIRLVRPIDADVARAISAATGQKWQVVFDEAGPAEPTLRAQELAAKEAERAAILADPLVAAAMAAFPDAQLSEVRSMA